VKAVPASRRLAELLSEGAGAAPARLSRSRWLTVAAAGLVIVFWGLLLKGQAEALAQQPWAVAPGSLALAVLLCSLSQLSMAGCWVLLLRRMGGAAPAWRATRVWLLSMFTRYVPGNVWHILSRVAMADRLGVPGSQVLASAAVEQALTLVGALAVAAVTLPFWGGPGSAQAWLLALLPLGLLALHPRLLGRFLTWAAARWRRPYLAWRYTFGEMLGLVACYMGAMLLSGLALFAVVAGVSDVALTQLPFCIGVAMLAWSVGYLSFVTPSGLGVREGVIVLLLAQVVPVPVAIVSSLLARLSFLVGEASVVAAAWLLGRSS
jgi:glycosyltransferase 2 family protein